VVAGLRTATPEILGQAAHYVNTEDPRAIADGILTVLADPALRAHLRQAGLTQAARYSSHRAVGHYRQLYEELLRQPITA
jgi:glycosyltransferase involved in cell wall biosynthesis